MDNKSWLQKLWENNLVTCHPQLRSSFRRAPADLLILRLIWVKISPFLLVFAVEGSIGGGQETERNTVNSLGNASERVTL